MPPGIHDSSDTASACSPGRATEAVVSTGKEETVLRPPETQVTGESRPEKDYDSSATVCFHFVLLLEIKITIKPLSQHRGGKRDPNFSNKNFFVTFFLIFFCCYKHDCRFDLDFVLF